MPAKMLIYHSMKACRWRHGLEKLQINIVVSQELTFLSLSHEANVSWANICILEVNRNFPFTFFPTRLSAGFVIKFIWQVDK